MPGIFYHHSQRQGRAILRSSEASQSPPLKGEGNQVALKALGLQRCGDLVQDCWIIDGGGR